jgi:hypothetical protein
MSRRFQVDPLAFLPYLSFDVVGFEGLSKVPAKLSVEIVSVLAF